MIRYTVLWQQEAEDELAKIWLDYPDRRRITRAADRIEAVLREDAGQKGLPMPSRAWVLTCSPLSVFFRIDEADRKVVVVGVTLSDTN